MADLQTILDEVHARRARRRPPLVMAAVIAGGFLAAAVGVLLIVPLPEAGVPLLLVGLRLLALRFGWAATAYAHVKWRWNRLRAWWKAKPRWVRDVVVVAAVVLVLAIAKLIW